VPEGLTGQRLRFEQDDLERAWGAHVDREARGPVVRGLVLFAVVLLLAIPGDYWQDYQGWQAVIAIRLFLWAPLVLGGAWAVARHGERFRVLDVTLGLAVVLTLSVLGLMLFVLPPSTAVDFPMYWAVLLLLVHLVTPLGVRRATAAGAVVVASFFATMLYHGAERRELSAHGVFLLFAWVLLIGASWLIESYSRQAFRAKWELLARTRELAALTRLQGSVLGALSDGVCGLAADGRIRFANAAAETLLGVPTGGLVGLSFHDCFHAPADAAPDPCPLCAVPTDAHEVATSLRRPDGTRLTVECSARPNGAGEEPVVRVVSFRDTGPRRALETRLRQSQKMEAIGNFVGGVAHEFNNLLTPILGGVSVARMVLGPEHGLQGTLAGLQAAGQRAAELVGQLLASGLRSELAREPVDLSETVRHVLAVVRPTLDRRITVTFTPSGDAWALADPGQVHQVVLNLCINARDAVMTQLNGPRGAAIRFATRRFEGVEPSAVGDPAAREGSWVEVEVTDTGPGIPPEVLPHIFEPFFTTKRVGEGSGLGLSVTHGIVTQHGGWISATSEVGVGSTFRCTFPATSQVVASDNEGSLPPRARAGATVLIVEDEPAIRDMIRTMLDAFGYVVEEAASGETALARLEAGFRPDAILLDILMPGMDGWEALAGIRAIDPSIPVIVMSGYDSRNPRGASPDPEAGQPEARLRKPFQIPDLIGTLVAVVRR
jgi:signal transduction histidine kinase